MRIQLRGNTYECLGLSFGFAACHYYCSAWSAKFWCWVKHHLRDCAHKVDDCSLVGSSLEEIRWKCARLTEMFESVGLSMQPEKITYGTSVKYLGVVLDTVRMRLRIDVTQALGIKCSSKMLWSRSSAGRR